MDMKVFLRWPLFLGLGAVLFPSLTEKIRPSFAVPLTGSLVVLTGSSSGIGKSAALDLAAQNYTVFAGVRSLTDGFSLQKEAKLRGIRPDLLRPVLLDVTSPASIADVRDAVVRTGLPMAGIVCNAGFVPYALMPFEYTSTEAEAKAFGVNYFGAAGVARVFLPLLRKHKARLVIVGSVAGSVARPLGQPYSASKFAVRSLADSLRRELRASGVSVSRVDPGYVSTPMLSKGRASLQSNVSFEALAPTDRAPYQKIYDAALVKISRAASGAAGPEDSTDAALRHALAAPKPRAVYNPGTIGARPAWLGATVLGWFSSLDPAWLDLAMGV